MEERLIAALDQGTTSTRVIVFTETGHAVASFQREMVTEAPEPGHVEQDPDLFENNAKECFSKCVEQLKEKGIDPSRVVTIGITNQRETTILFDRKTGKPVYNALVWSDARTADIAQTLKKKKGADRVQHLCGLPISTYFAGVKVRWLVDNVPEAKEVYERGDLAFATVDSWILYRLTGGNHVTDVTNASRSMFMNIEKLKYDDELIEFFGVEKLVLPEIRPSSGYFGDMKEGFPLAGTPIRGCIGDQSSALIGHFGFSQGDVKNTYGTGCFLLYNTGKECVRSENGLISTLLFQDEDKNTLYALEGSVAVAGSVIKWFKNNVGLIELSSQIGELAEQVEDNGGVSFVTAFSGLFAPYWNEHATGTIVGLTHFSEAGHLARAAIEAVCFQTRAILDTMVRESGTKFTQLRVDGGMTASDITMLTQANILGIDVVRPAMREPTALGAALTAGLAHGVWKNWEDAKKSMAHLSKATKFAPEWDAELREYEYARWTLAVEAASVYGDRLQELKEWGTQRAQK
uniref:glycerol kinase n=1 Tax=Blastobotrys adeninivorans TaxID=409370 RepID=A0A060T2M5_BLAAD